MDSSVYGTYRSWPRLTTMYDNHSFERNEQDKSNVIVMYNMGHKHPVDAYGSYPHYNQPMEHPVRKPDAGDPHGKEEGSGGSETDISHQSRNRKQSCWMLTAVCMALVLLGVIVAAVILAILLTKTPSEGQASFDEGFKSLIRLENATYSTALEDPDSSAYKALEAEFCDQLLAMLKAPDSPAKAEDFECSVEEFRKGSVDVFYLLRPKTRPNPEHSAKFAKLLQSISKFFASKIKSGKLGSFAVNPKVACKAFPIDAIFDSSDCMVTVTSTSPSAAERTVSASTVIATSSSDTVVTSTNTVPGPPYTASATSDAMITVSSASLPVISTTLAAASNPLVPASSRPAISGTTTPVISGTVAATISSIPVPTSSVHAAVTVPPATALSASTSTASAVAGTITATTVSATTVAATASLSTISASSSSPSTTAARLSSELSSAGEVSITASSEFPGATTDVGNFLTSASGTTVSTSVVSELSASIIDTAQSSFVLTTAVPVSATTVVSLDSMTALMTGSLTSNIDELSPSATLQVSVTSVAGMDSTALYSSIAEPAATPVTTEGTTKFSEASLSVTEYAPGVSADGASSFLSMSVMSSMKPPTTTTTIVMATASVSLSASTTAAIQPVVASASSVLYSSPLTVTASLAPSVLHSSPLTATASLVPSVLHSSPLTATASVAPSATPVFVTTDVSALAEPSTTVVVPLSISSAITTSSTESLMTESEIFSTPILPASTEMLAVISGVSDTTTISVSDMFTSMQPSALSFRTSPTMPPSGLVSESGASSSGQFSPQTTSADVSVQTTVATDVGSDTVSSTVSVTGQVYGSLAFTNVFSVDSSSPSMSYPSAVPGMSTMSHFTTSLKVTGSFDSSAPLYRAETVPYDFSPALSAPSGTTEVSSSHLSLGVSFSASPTITADVISSVPISDSLTILPATFSTSSVNAVASPAASITDAVSAMVSPLPSAVVTSDTLFSSVVDLSASSTSLATLASQSSPLMSSSFSLDGSAAAESLKDTVSMASTATLGVSQPVSPQSLSTEVVDSSGVSTKTSGTPVFSGFMVSTSTLDPASLVDGTVLPSSDAVPSSPAWHVSISSSEFVPTLVTAASDLKPSSMYSTLDQPTVSMFSVAESASVSSSHTEQLPTSVLVLSSSLVPDIAPSSSSFSNRLTSERSAHETSALVSSVTSFITSLPDTTLFVTSQLSEPVSSKMSSSSAFSAHLNSTSDLTSTQTLDSSAVISFHPLSTSASFSGAIFSDLMSSTTEIILVTEASINTEPSQSMRTVMWTSSSGTTNVTSVMWTSTSGTTNATSAYTVAANSSVISASSVSEVMPTASGVGFI